MTNEIKIIGNVRKRSIYDPDLAQKIIEEERRRIEEEKKSGKKAVDKAAGNNGNSGTGAANPSVIPKTASLDDYILLKDINCIDSDGKVFESYPELYVAKDIIHNKDKSQVSKTLYKWIVYHEQNGLFLPSVALSCNILAELYQRISDAEMKAVLMQYKDKGNSYGWHAQNTIIDYASEEIIHYPNATDFKGAVAINAAQQRTARDFSKSKLYDKALKEALKIPVFAKYVKNLTGLENPSILVDIGGYFNKPAILWFPWSGQDGKNYNGKRVCWLGCDNYYFSLDSDYGLNYSDASRRVRKNFP